VTAGGALPPARASRARAVALTVIAAALLAGCLVYGVLRLYSGG
jgi:hypothetical protein